MSFTLPPGVARGSQEAIYLLYEYLADVATRAPFISGRWYPMLPGLSGAGAAIGTANSIRLVPFLLTEPMSVGGMATRIHTISAAGNIQLAIYAHDAEAGLPTGEALATTGNLSTGTLGAVSADLAEPVALDRGIYWMAVNADNTAVVCNTSHNSMDYSAFLVGSTVALEAFGPITWTIAQTFGTWPDLTGGTFAKVFTLTHAIMRLKAA